MRGSCEREEEEIGRPLPRLPSSSPSSSSEEGDDAGDEKGEQEQAINVNVAAAAVLHQT